MSGNSELREMRYSRGLRRNRMGLARNSMLAYTKKRPGINMGGGSTTSSSSSSGNKYKESRGNIGDGALGMAERVLHNRRNRDDTCEGVESMHHSLARNVISSAGWKNANGHGHHSDKKSFQLRYARLLQDEESRGYEEQDAVAFEDYVSKPIFKCWTIFLLTLCFIAFISHDVGSKQTIPQHNQKYQSQIKHSSETEERMSLLSSFSNLTVPYDSQREIPFFLDLKLTGATLVKRSISKCFNLTMACELGLRQPNYQESELSIFPSLYDGYMGTYVNVDLSSRKGIQRAKDFNLTSSSLADVISMDSLYEGSRLFAREPGVDHDNAEMIKGRLFTVFAHPISRTIGYYHYLKQATWDKNYSQRISDLTLLQFASSKYIEDNPMVRLLSDKQFPFGVSESELEVAKRVVEVKGIVGLYRDLDGSLARFERYFGWNEAANEKNKQNARKCKQQLLDVGDKWLSMQSDKIEGDDEVWKKMAESQKLDLELYDFVESLYKIQGEEIFDIVE